MSTVNKCNRCNQQVSKDRMWKTDNGFVHVNCGGTIIVELRVSVGERLGNWGDSMGKSPKR